MLTDGLNKIVTKRQLRWLVTGVAGFIGSHLAETLVELGQMVVGIDDFSTGSISNISAVEAAAARFPGSSFRFVEGSIEHLELCEDVTRGTDIVLHQAALGSIPRSIENPVRTHEVNATGTLNMLVAARDAQVKRFVYASSSSVYGNDQSLPKREDQTGLPLAPYASSKKACEFYARNFAQHYNLQTVGLRYFNVFGPRQDPNGAYAAVVPKWIDQMSRGIPVTINGDGRTSRDFCYVANVIQANLLAALGRYDPDISIFNIAFGERTTLNQLHGYIAKLVEDQLGNSVAPPQYGQERKGDVRHSQADITLVSSFLGYHPTHDVVAGLRETVGSYFSKLD